MRVLIAADSIGALGTLAAGNALGRAWVGLGADVAVLPIGEAGDGLVQALADDWEVPASLLPTAPGEPVAVCVDGGARVAVGLAGGAEPATSSAPLGRAVLAALADTDPRRLYVDLSWAGAAPDAGAGFLAALGARADAPLERGLAGLDAVTRLHLDDVRARLGGVELIGLLPAAQEGAALLGLRGLASTQGFAAGQDIEAVLAADAALERYAALVGGDGAQAESAGACGGAAFAVAALGGRLATGVGLCAELGQLEQSLAVCDVVVAACDRFDFHFRGGPVVEFLSEQAARAGKPLIVVAGQTMIGNREMRTIGVEAAYALDLADPTQEQVTERARAIARTWMW